MTTVQILQSTPHGVAILTAIRNRLGWDETPPPADTKRNDRIDKQINSAKALDLFKLYCGWHFGDDNWGYQFMNTLDTLREATGDVSEDQVRVVMESLLHTSLADCMDLACKVQNGTHETDKHDGCVRLGTQLWTFLAFFAVLPRREGRIKTLAEWLQKMATKAKDWKVEDGQAG